MRQQNTRVNKKKPQAQFSKRKLENQGAQPKMRSTGPSCCNVVLGRAPCGRVTFVFTITMTTIKNDSALLDQLLDLPQILHTVLVPD